jgi:hypothetical protein
MNATTVLGHRSPVQEEHDMPPTRVLVVSWPDELPGLGGRVELVDDGSGAVPTFETAVCADLCAAELRAAVPGLDLAVVEVWRGFVAQTLLGDRDPHDMTDAEVEELTMRGYVFEAQTFGEADALRQASELAGRIAAGWECRLTRTIGEAA